MTSSNETVQLCNLPNTMKAIVLGAPSEHFSLSEIEIPLPHCDNNEILVKVESVGLNPLDAHFAKTGFCKWQYPRTLGLDAVGIVVQARKGQSPSIGERVMWHSSLAEQGVLSEYAKVPNYAIALVPENMSSNTAAAIPCSGLTALIAVEKIQINEGDTVLVEAGAGAVGQYAIQLAKQRGANVFTTASKHNHKLVKKLGADAVFDYKDPSLCEKMQTALGAQGFDAVIDAVGGDTTTRNIELMRFCGRIACLKALPTLAPELMFRKAPNISIVSLGGAWLANSLCAQQRMSFMNNQLLESVDNGNLSVPAILPINFNALAVTQALHNQVAGGFTGKQVVKVQSSK